MKTISFDVSDEQYGVIEAPEEFAKKQFVGKADYRLREAEAKERNEHLDFIKTLSTVELAEIARPIKESVAVNEIDSIGKVAVK